jgi:hypothetical protein
VVVVGGGGHVPATAYYLAKNHGVHNLVVSLMVVGATSVWAADGAPATSSTTEIEAVDHFVTPPNAMVVSHGQVSIAGKPLEYTAKTGLART